MKFIHVLNFNDIVSILSLFPNTAIHVRFICAQWCNFKLDRIDPLAVPLKN